jgi:hypothetical protein
MSERKDATPGKAVRFLGIGLTVLVKKADLDCPIRHLKTGKLQYRLYSKPRSATFQVTRGG